MLGKSFHGPLARFSMRSARSKNLSLGMWILISVGVALLVIAVLSVILPAGSTAATFLLDHDAASLFAPIYPLTIQNLLHVLTAIA